MHHVRWRAALVAAPLLLFAIPQASHAQAVQADVVASCGSVTYSAGQPNHLTQDTTGKLCDGGGGGGGGGGQSGTNISVIPTIQNAAYAANNCMGTGFQTVAMGATPSVLNQVSIASKGGLTLAKTVWLFTANPTGSTCTDKGTFTVAQADMGKVVAIITLTPAASNGQTGTFASQSGLGVGIPSGGTMYAAIVDSGVETPGSATDLTVGFSGF